MYLNPKRVAKELHISIYDEIGTVITADSIKSQLQAQQDASEIFLHIHSPGGNVYEGYTIYNLLKDSGKKITSKIEGVCASIATLIALSAEHIEMMPLSQWLIHPPFAGIEGTADDFEQAAGQLRSIENTLAALYVEKTGKSLEEITSLMKEDRFLTAQEALELGFANRIAEPIKAVAFYKSPETLNKNKMPETQKTSKWKQLANFIASLGGEEEESGPAASSEDGAAAPVASSAALENGDNIYFAGELSEGSVVYSDAEMSNPLPDGEHILSDGRILVVAAGIVEAINEPEPSNAAAEELEAVKAENESLKAELAKAKTDIEAKAKTVRDLQGHIRAKAQTKPAQNFAGDNVDPGTGGHPLDGAAKAIVFKQKR